ncbi:unnamed protein product [Polarella glacialis]|uniref:DNA polymerase kappa n=1 Tax=Polarella glacialis TaxID=89957 RepID=A0A813FEC1_POLGL|nr:unnamed protein product [Polarella glacialis]
MAKSSEEELLKIPGIESRAPVSESSGANSHLFAFTGVSSNKAGMGADRKMVADFVYERCRNSQYTQHALELDAKQRSRTEALTVELQATEARMSEPERAAETRRVNVMLDDLEKHRDLSRTFCVVDMDMFYAAVELRDQPHLASKPVAIGGLGMISTANYVARMYGVRSAMPGFIAVEMVRNPALVGSKMPPDELVFIPPDFAKYTRAANETREIFKDYDPDFRAMSLDEAYLDLTQYLASRGGPDAAEEVVHELRTRIKVRTSLTCSAGIGPNCMLARIASEDNKPDGQTRISSTREAVLQYMGSLPIRRVPGCGKVLEHQLATMLGVSTCGELHAVANRVRRAFESRPKSCSFLLRACLGLSGDDVAEEQGDEIGSVGRKSLSTERTFKDESGRSELFARLRELCRQLSEEMAASVPPLAARIVALKTKASNFEVRNKQFNSVRAVGFSTDFGSNAVSGGEAARETGEDASSQKIGDAACEAELARVAEDLYKLLEPALEEQYPCTLRLMGVRVSAFRGQKAVLQRGQQQLGSFFRTGRPGSVAESAHTLPAVSSAADLSSAKPDFSLQEKPPVIDLDDGSPSLDDEDDHRMAPAPAPASDVQGIHSECQHPAASSASCKDEGKDLCIELSPDSTPERAAAAAESSGSCQQLANKPGRAPISASTVCCPVCGMRVSLSDADRHVNGHYDSADGLNAVPVIAITHGSTATDGNSKRRPKDDTARPAKTAKIASFFGPRGGDRILC